MPRCFPLLLLLLLLIAPTACAPADDVQLAVEDFRYRRMPGGARILTGQLRNTGAALVDNAQVQVSLFDADNRRIGSMIILVRDIPPDSVRRFHEAVDSDDPIHAARVRSILVL